mmetsp:Transcript_49330/g.119621  ORF Transcript_49330/g.119621 Transcript_49330/m.119621 type:complete len:247 (-) Transcript_49330:1119-1859(-)
MLRLLPRPPDLLLLLRRYACRHLIRVVGRVELLPQRRRLLLRPCPRGGELVRPRLRVVLLRLRVGRLLPGLPQPRPRSLRVLLRPHPALIEDTALVLLRPLLRRDLLPGLLEGQLQLLDPPPRRLGLDAAVVGGLAVLHHLLLEALNLHGRVGVPGRLAHRLLELERQPPAPLQRPLRLLPRDRLLLFRLLELGLKPPPLLLCRARPRARRPDLLRRGRRPALRVRLGSLQLSLELVACLEGGREP